MVAFVAREPGWRNQPPRATAGSVSGLETLRPLLTRNPSAGHAQTVLRPRHKFGDIPHSLDSHP